MANEAISIVRILLVLVTKSIALQPFAALSFRNSMRLTPVRESVSPQEEEASYPSQREIVEKIRELSLEDLAESDEIDTESLPELPAEDLDDSLLSQEEIEKIKAGKAALDAWMGDIDGRDDDLDAAWRKEAEAAIRDAVTDLDVRDIAWDIDVLRVTVARDDDSYISAEDTGRTARSIHDALEPLDDKLRVLDRFELEVTSPGVANVLTMQREFDAFKGFDVEVDTINPIEPSKPRTLYGKLVERKPLELSINQKGRIVKVPSSFFLPYSESFCLPQIPTNLVNEVRLPPAMEEDE